MSRTTLQAVRARDWHHAWKRLGKSIYDCIVCGMSIKLNGGAADVAPHRDQTCLVEMGRESVGDALVGDLSSCETFLAARRER